MFTGIIEELGSVRNIIHKGKLIVLEIKADAVLKEVRIGDSIAINGVCLTVTKRDSDYLAFEVMPQTLKNTNLGILRIADRVNLERALKLGDRLSGHFVLGHVDTIGLVRKKTYVNDNLCFEIAVDSKFMKYIIPQGSVAIDGISLTIVNRYANTFTVYIIPHTLKHTTLGFKGPSEKVNVEFDILTKQANSI